MQERHIIFNLGAEGRVNESLETKDVESYESEKMLKSLKKT